MGPEGRLKICVINGKDSTYKRGNKLCINEMTNMRTQNGKHNKTKQKVMRTVYVYINRHTSL